MRLHAAVRGPGKIISSLYRQGVDGPGISGERFRRPGAGIEPADRAVLSAELRRDVPNVREDVRRWRERKPALSDARHLDREAAALEFPQVSPRQGETTCVRCRKCVRSRPCRGTRRAGISTSISSAGRDNRWPCSKVRSSPRIHGLPHRSKNYWLRADITIVQTVQAVAVKIRLACLR